MPSWKRANSLRGGGAKLRVSRGRDGRTAEGREFKTDHIIINLGGGNYGGLRRKQLLSVEKDRIRKLREPDLTRLRDLPRAEAVRIAMIKNGWDAATAAEKVAIEQGRYAEEMAGRTKPQSA
jgi:hypothetical protein